MSCDCVNISRGKQGDPGVSSILYIAYASDANGTGFSLIPDSTLPFISFVVKQSPVSSLVLADFPVPFLQYLGTDGADGKGYDAASVTSNTIGTGSKTFTITVDKAYVVGSRMRFADSANPTTNWMEGVATAVNSGTGVVTVTIDKTLGSGTIASWNVSLAGEPGTNGTNARTTLFNDLSQNDSGDTGGVTTIFETQNIPANTLIANGDSVCMEVVLQCVSTVFTISPYMKVKVGGASVAVNTYSSNNQTTVVKATIDRISSTTYVLTTQTIDGFGVVGSFSQIVTGADFTATIAVDVLANTNGNVGGIICRKNFAEYKPI